MRVYLDTSVLVALLTADPLSRRADAFFRVAMPIPVVSDFAAAEFASVLARRMRMREIGGPEAERAFADLDRWTGRVAERISLEPSDVAAAAGLLRRLDLTLRTPDALNLVLCRRGGAELATFDAKMAAVAAAIGLPVVVA